MLIPNGFYSHWGTLTFTNLTDVEVNMNPLNMRSLLSSDIRKYQSNKYVYILNPNMNDIILIYTNL